MAADDNSLLIEIFNKVSETSIAVARLESNLANLVSRTDIHEQDIRQLRDHRVAALESAVQKLESDATANKVTVEVTAKALREAEEARRDKTTQSWSPLTRISLFATVVAALSAFYATFHH